MPSIIILKLKYFNSPFDFLFRAMITRNLVAEASPLLQPVVGTDPGWAMSRLLVNTSCSRPSERVILPR